MICAPRFAASLIPEIAFLRFASGFWSQLICTNPTVVELLARIFLTMPRSILKGTGERVKSTRGNESRFDYRRNVVSTVDFRSAKRFWLQRHLNTLKMFEKSSVHTGVFGLPAKVSANGSCFNDAESSGFLESTT